MGTLCYSATNFSVRLRLFQNKVVFERREPGMHTSSAGVVSWGLPGRVVIHQHFRPPGWPKWIRGRGFNQWPLEAEPSERRPGGALAASSADARSERDILGATRLDAILSFLAGTAFPNASLHNPSSRGHSTMTPALADLCPNPVTCSFSVTFAMSTSAGREWSLPGILEQNSIYKVY